MKQTHLAALLVAVVLASIPALAEPLFGPEFSSPEKQIEMGREWRNKPIQYKQGIHADLVVSLDQNLAPALIPLIREYAKQQGIKIVIQSGTCGISSGGLMRKEIDIGGFCCPPGTNDRYPGVRFHTLGIMPIYLIVHPDNPVRDISLQQARDLFSGRAYKWSDVDHRKEESLVHPITRLHCKLRPGHWRLILGDEDLFSPGFHNVGAISDMVYAVAHDKAAIGYEVPTMLLRYREYGKVKRLSIDGKGFSDLLTGQYPFYRVYSLTTWSDPHTRNEHADKLVEYLKQQVEHLPPEFEFIPSSQLKRAGWPFRGDELIGAPGTKK